jgi:hypothetical protein
MTSSWTLVAGALVMALLFAGMARAQEITAAERIELMASARASCESNYVGQLTTSGVQKFCDCVAKRITEQRRDEGLPSRLAPELQKRMEAAGAECLPADSPSR